MRGVQAAICMLGILFFCSGCAKPGQAVPDENIITITCAPTERILLPEIESTPGINVPSVLQSPLPSVTQSPTQAADYPMKKFKYKQSASVVGNGVNLREGPGTEYGVVKELVVKGTKATVLAESGDWYYLTMDEATGFMKKEFVLLDAYATPSPTPKPSITNAPQGNYSEEEIYMAAQMIYLEAGNASRNELRAIANVLANRIASGEFSGTVKGNIFAPGQFSVADNREWFLSCKPSDAAIKAARDVLNEGIRILPEDVLYFWAKRKGTFWNDDREYYKTIGNHCFFR